MPTWGRKLAITGRPALGIGMQVAPGSEPKAIVVAYDNFRHGLMLAERPADVPDGFYSFAQDIETSRRDGVIRSPGVTLVEDTGHSLQWLLVHPGLDFQSVLLAFDAPFLGIKEAGNFTWTDEGLDDHGESWVGTAYGNTLLFSNGRVGYSRDFDTQVVAVVADMPGARTLFTAFGRVFAGNILQGGQYNVLGVSWTGLSGTFDDWLGDGSGSELLLADVPHGDKIIAGRVLSYDLVAVLCRHSLWIGARTGQLDRPADFQFRVMGVGCVTEPTAKTTEAGVTFLSDEGVRHFNGTEAPVISTAINAELLPLDFDNIDKYKSEWLEDRRRYILSTPTATYLYQFPTGDYPNGAWFKRTIIADNVVTFAQQTHDPSWLDLLDRLWTDLWETWGEFATPESDDVPDLLFISGTRYGVQDSAATANLGVATDPLFQPRPKQQQLVDMPDRAWLTQSFLIQYHGGGTIDILAVTENEESAVVATIVLPMSANATRTVRADVFFSSQAIGIFVRITAGFPEIMSIKQVILDNGPVIASVGANTGPIP